MPKISAARKDERRRQILRAAVNCFARHGFHQTTIQDICAESGLSPGAVYGYFESKDAIVEALAEAARRTGVDRQAAAQREANAAEQLKSFLAEFDKPGAARLNQFDVRLWAEAIDNRQLREIYLRGRLELLEALNAIVAEPAVALHLKPEVLAELAAAVIVGCEVRRAIEPSADVGPVLDALLAVLGLKAPKKR